MVRDDTCLDDTPPDQGPEPEETAAHQVDGGGAQFFVHAGNEVDILFLQPLLGAPKLLIITAQRRAAITGNETAGVQPGGGVAPFLHQRQPHQRPSPPRLLLLHLTQQPLLLLPPVLLPEATFR